jgi:hypothetical protein
MAEIIPDKQKRLKDIIDAVSSPPIKSKLIEIQKNITMTRNSKKPKNLKSNVTNKLSDLRIYHQNIRGLSNKTDELLSQWVSQSPHNFCLKEHHLKKAEITRTSINNYNPGAHWYRKCMKNGGIGIFVHKSLQYVPTDLEEFCIDQIIEACAIKLYHSTDNICILTVYRAPTGNCLHFLNSLEVILNRIHTRSIKIILCGDININYLDDTGSNKPRLNTLLASYHLSSIVNFPTRVSGTSATAIDNIFINRNTNETFSIILLPNRLSDHDAQLLTLSNMSFFELFKLFCY